MNAEDVLERCIQLGVSGVELRAQPIEKSMGLPEKIVLGPAPVDYAAVFTPYGDVPGMPLHGGGHRPASPGAPAGASDPTANGPASTPEGLAKYQAAAAELRQWRTSAPLGKAKEIRKKYHDAGVAIDIVKFDGLCDLPEEELDYAFTLAKTLGARAISGELSMPGVKRIAQVAERHKMMAGLHGHVAVTPAILEQCFALGKYVGANVDMMVRWRRDRPAPPSVARQNCNSKMGKLGLVFEWRERCCSSLKPTGTMPVRLGFPMFGRFTGLMTVMRTLSSSPTAARSAKT